MPDPITALSTALEMFGRVREAIEKVKSAEARAALADLQLALSDLKMELATERENIAAVREENVRLRQQLAGLQAAANRPPTVEHRKGLLYLTEPKAGQSPGPYCPACHAISGRMVPLTDVRGSVEEVFGSHSCPGCREFFRELR